MKHMISRNDTSYRILSLLIIAQASTFAITRLHAMQYPELAELENIPYQEPYHAGPSPSMIPPLLAGIPVTDFIGMHGNTAYNPLNHKNQLVVLNEQTLIAFLTVIIRYELQRQHYTQEPARNILYQFRDYPILGLISLAYESYPQLTLAALGFATGTALWNYDKIIEFYKKTREKVMKALVPIKPSPKK